MKRFFLLVIVSTFSTIIFGQNGQHYYWYKGEKQFLQLKTDKTFILLNSKIDKKVLSEKLGANEFNIGQIRKIELGTSDKRYQTQYSNSYWTVVNSERGQLDLSSDNIIYHAPFFETLNGIEIGLSNFLYIKLRDKADESLLKDMAERYKVEILGNDSFMPLWYTLSSNQYSLGNSLEIANIFYETGLFVESIPDFMEDVLLSYLQNPNDPFFGDQWSFNNTGQYGGTSGEDIQLMDAWEITQSHSDIVLAVVDHGIEMNHPDLPNIHMDSYDTESESSPSLVLGSHGTAVSGIVGANSDNSEGVVGIAPKGQLMSISNSLEGSPNSRMKRAGGINFAWKNGAHVINNSWGSDTQFPVIEDAIDSATTFGRGGLGTIVVFAVGNSNLSTISHPSINSKVIAVGASSMCGERKSYTSCDTEDQWGSNYGTGLDVMAPGVLIPTTDRQGGSGYNPAVPFHTLSNVGGSLLTVNDEYNNQDYTIWFIGTSAAAPHVSGIASLVLSINNDLTIQEVRNAIEGSAEKVGGYNYTMGSGEQQGLTWNNEMGYGRVNAYESLIYTIENYGAHLGNEMSQVTIPLWSNLVLQEDITLESGAELTIEANNNITISAASGSVTIGGTGSSAKILGGDKNDIVDNNSEPNSKPDNYGLSNNYPNPFNPTTIIQYEVPVAGKIELSVFDLLGRKIATLVDGRVEAGRKEILFDASNLSSGMYIYRLIAGEFVQTKKMMLIK